MLRRKFPQPEQSANGISDNELMRELDCKESDERMQMDTEHLHEKYIMTVINAGGSHLFNMPFNALGKTLHKAGDGLNEFDLINNHKYTLSEIDSVIAKEFSRESMVHFDDFLFESLRPGQEIGDSVCDLCLKW